MTRFKQDKAAQTALANTVKLTDMKAEDFDTVFYPGGHGPNVGSCGEPNLDRSSRSLLQFRQANRIGVPRFCQESLRHVTYQGAPLVKGKHVAGFTNGEEEEVQLTKVVPFLVEDELLRLGAIYEKMADWQPFSVTDGKISYTGQNPASSTSAAQALLKRHDGIAVRTRQQTAYKSNVQKSYEMPPKEGMSIAHFLTVGDINRSLDYYEKVLGARILSRGDGNAPGYLQLANIWMIMNVGGGPTPDKPTVTLSVPDPNHINSFLNFRVADIQACYKLWKSRGAEFITEPIPKYGEIRCYIRDPDGYIIEVGQSTDLTYG